MARAATKATAPAATFQPPTVETPAAPVAPALTFTVVDGPTVGRKETVNPLAAGVQSAVTLMTEQPGKGLAFTVLPDDVDKNVNWIRRAARDANVTAIIVPAKNEDGSYTGQITFRVRPKITKKPKTA